MCDTHEPPPAIRPDPTLELDGVGRNSPVAVTDAPAADNAARAATYTEEPEKAAEVDAAAIEYSGNITRSEICAFMVGYAAFLSETSVGVSSVLHFMPGTKVAIATNPTDFDVFNR